MHFASCQDLCKRGCLVKRGQTKRKQTKYKTGTTVVHWETVRTILGDAQHPAKGEQSTSVFSAFGVMSVCFNLYIVTSIIVNIQTKMFSGW